MKRLLAVFVMLALPAAAQDHRPSTGAGGGNASGAKAGAGSGSGGSTASSGGGSSSGGSGGGAVSRGGSGGGSVSSGGARSSGGGEHAASGGSGVAVSRNPERGSSTNTNGGRHGDAGAINSGSATASGSGAKAAPRAAGTAADSARGARTGDGNATGVPPYARPRTDQPVIGTAVPRGSVPPATGGIGGAIYPSGGVGYYYPWWWFGGAGFYGSYWGYNYYGYPGYYGGGGYSGYSDPWFGGYPDAQDPLPQGGGSSSFADEGTLKLKIKPNTAEVYVDGFYVGVVDDFDGMFQKLHIESGPHRIEVRAEGYEPLVFEVRITTDHATTYQGELKRIQ
jgi:hypothetical protein